MKIGSDECSFLGSERSVRVNQARSRGDDLRRDTAVVLQPWANIEKHETAISDALLIGLTTAGRAADEVTVSSARR
jgi:hypothetical protein